MSTFKGYREGSRANWGCESGGGNLTIEQINCGALLRVADAVEKMAQRHTELIAARDHYERWYRETRVREDALARRLAAAKGQITKLRKQLAAQVAPAVAI